MSALLPTPADFAATHLSLERAAQIFPALRVSIIENRHPCPVTLGADMKEWTGRPETLLIRSGAYAYCVDDQRVELHVLGPMTIRQREFFYRGALEIARDGLTSPHGWTWRYQDSDGKTWSRVSHWVPLSDDAAADYLIDLVTTAGKEATR